MNQHLTDIEYQEKVFRCIHCGLCLQSCPTYSVVGTEMDAPRGRITMMRALITGRLPLSEAISRHIYTCIGCMACKIACPSGVITDQIFHGAKEIIAGSQFFPASIGEQAQRVRATNNIAGEPAANRFLWTENLADKPTDLFGKPGAEVVVFTGCVSALYPLVYGILQSLVGVLRAANVDFTVGSDEWCCGYPLYEAGLDVAELKAHNLARVEALGAKTLITTCPSCYYMWKNQYAPTSFKVLHATEYLAQLVQEGRLPLRALNTRVTYHDPCDLGRRNQVYDTPRQLIRAIPGVEFVEMKANRENAFCCGGGGNLESVDVELSRAVARTRLEQARDVGAGILVSACQQCERTLGMAARRERIRVKVMDITQLLEEALKDGAT